MNIKWRLPWWPKENKRLVCAKHDIRYIVAYQPSEPNIPPYYFCARCEFEDGWKKEYATNN